MPAAPAGRPWRSSERGSRQLRLHTCAVRRPPPCGGGRRVDLYMIWPIIMSIESFIMSGLAIGMETAKG